MKDTRTTQEKIDAFIEEHTTNGRYADHRQTWVELWKSTSGGDLAKQLTQTALQYRTSEPAINRAIATVYSIDIRELIKQNG